MNIPARRESIGTQTFKASVRHQPDDSAQHPRTNSGMIAILPPPLGLLKRELDKVQHRDSPDCAKVSPILQFSEFCPCKLARFHALQVRSESFDRGDQVTIESKLARGDLETILQAITSPKYSAAGVGQRRQLLLEKLATLIDAAGCFWGWGRGRPGTTAVTPVSAIPFGFTESEWANVARFCLSPEGQRITQDPIFARLKTTRQATVARHDIASDKEWYASSVYQHDLQPAGVDHFLSSVRYCSNDVWCCLTFFRRLKKPRYQHRESEIVDLVMAGIGWLAPQVSESIPEEPFAEITPRQRLVMLFLLDGLSRKQIAANLGLTLHTVNDHVKALYHRFDVQSATDLAARFLKSVRPFVRPAKKYSCVHTNIGDGQPRDLPYHFGYGSLRDESWATKSI